MILDANVPGAIDRAAQVLADGELLGLPTETVYGLAADAGSDAAVAKIFAAKGRPSDHPLIVHVAPGVAGAVPAAVARFADAVPAWAEALMRSFWPGPLTLIVPRRAGVGAAAAGGQDSIGLRCPSHPVAQAVLQAAAALGVHGVAAPSANQFGRVSPTTAAHVASEFGDGLLVLDGGPCVVGIESTIVDCTRGVPVLLRPGGIARDRIEQVSGLPLRGKDELAADPRASGTLASHYAPRASVRLMAAPALQTAVDLLDTELAQAPGGPPAVAVYARSALRSRSARIVQRRMPGDAAAAAQQLFAVLRELDGLGVRLIWVETPPDTHAWEGVRDRLQRAAAE
ncbi:L-threonylcarbamoyladenylate synthase [Pseudorhodoferax sp. Leaf267]|uniref:L-threonylcarbamoyladenylate synthase n=1 Tax=Pseudorhodoferax sp. Leaf267 TaxID=1736316 RepID=UPI00070063C2|nr:L-threonylcarbamoyladenylate synthase [Pseudorhodoferax sp. Leaf267]KQP12544.1 translation factor Sua5 [Pseudorhodoferax sp. Leaf267]